MIDLTITGSTKQEKHDNGVQLCVRAAKEATDYMVNILSGYGDALEAYRAKGYVDDPEAPTVNINHVRPVVQSNVPRHASGLWPQRPYINFSARQQKEQGNRARLKVRAIDGQMDSAQFFPNACKWLYYGEMYGNGGLEPFWDTWIETIEDQGPIVDEFTGRVVGFEDAEPTKELRDGLKFRVHGPWAILWAPGSRDWLEAPWVVVKQTIPMSEVERLLELEPEDGGWTTPPGMKKTEFLDALKAGPKSDDQSAAAQFETDRRLFSDDLKEGVVIHLRLFSAGRWIDCLNYSYVVRDTENRMANIDPRSKPFAWLTVRPTLGAPTLYGEGIYSIIEDLSLLDNAVMSLYLEAMMMQNAPQWIYDQQYINKEDLIATPNNAIELIKSPSGRIDDVIKVLNGPQISDAPLNMHGMFTDWIDSRVTQTPISRGQAPTPKQTLGGSQILLAESVQPLNFQTRYVENDAMVQLAALVVNLCGRNMTIVQMMDAGGLTYEEAIEVKTPDPGDLPGGFDWEFEGSERLALRRQKTEDLTAFWNLAANDEMVATGPAKPIMLHEMAERTGAFSRRQLEMMGFEKMAEQLEAQVDAGAAPGGAPIPGVETESVGQDGAIAPPNQLASPAGNAAAAQEVAA